MACDTLSVDIETYSSVDIRRAGLYKYVQSPDFEVLLFAYRANSDAIKVVDLKSGEKIPADVRTALSDPLCAKHAYNAAFEWYCLSRLFDLTDGERDVWLMQWHCSQLHAMYCGYPASLDNAGSALELPQDHKKLSIGKRLIEYFCKPCKPTKANGGRTRNLPKHDPEKWALFKAYCIQDVDTECTIDDRLHAFPVPEQVQREWVVDQKINARGVRIDTSMVHAAIDISDRVSGKLTARAIAMTGLNNPASVAQLRGWLADEADTELPDLSKATVAAAIGSGNLGSTAEEVLRIRQELSKSSIKKYEAMDTCVCEDGRARGLIKFYGASRTGRWAGRLVQVQNLPQTHLSDLDLAREYVKTRGLDMLRLTYGNVPDVLSQLIRTAFIPSDGCKFAVADYSAIEARVIAWLAGELWRQDIFAKNGDIYCASASQMFKVPVEKHGVNGHLRQKGKIAELALGYGGSVGALKTMGALDMGLTEEELPDIVAKWREASPHIRELWYAIENAAIAAVRDCRESVVKKVVFRRECDAVTGVDFMTVQLPSGRKLFYPKPQIATNKFGKPAVSYMGTGDKTTQWGRLETYGGKLTENIVQAIARDCLAVTLVRLERAGYPVVMHIHDEAVTDCPENLAELDKLCDIMRQPIPWADGLILNADGFVGDYYKKD